ncbi:MAG: V-type ATP synthase subunit E family protein [Candidatus Omnitrophica bacterium]|jgi:V/A-type H+-transporting ATPase subunit E|nr:V-type ATP synthase subunit E family protein [Candidatus Omnitrophota bacterium]MDD5252874.1 V-type ATP synthase subunit E family protein [Candidatus Omnitrophota bacterium]
MAQEIKDLIAKIQTEGIQVAQTQAAQIKADAEKDATKIIAEAKARAEKIVEQAKTEAKKADDSTRAALEQAGRDLLISLRQEIIAMLERLIKSDLRQALSPEELAKIIGFLIKNAPLSLGSQIIVSLSQQDKDKLESGMLKQLVEETKKSVVLKSAEGLDSGFIISFDDGKSIFDFSGQALTDYISGSLRPELNKILNAK